MDLPNKILKICKIDSLSFGKFAILSGADYLGVHILEEKDIGKRVDLVKELSLLGAKIIIVTKISRLSQLEKIINLYNPKGLQLHFTPNIDLIKTVRKIYPDLEIFSVITNEINIKLNKQVFGLSDKIVYDTSYAGGTGENHHLDLLEKVDMATKNKFLIAGGVTLDFLKKYKNLDVAGFDAQSYFRESGQLHYDRVEAVSRLIRGPKKKILSVSITDLESVDVCVNEYEKNRHYNYHLDYSDGSLYTDFTTNKQQILKKIKLIKGVPISIHIFNKSEKQINKLMAEFLDVNNNSISSFFIQYFPGIDLNKISKNNNLIISIYYKDFEDYFCNWHDFTDYLSIILPSEDVERTQIILDYIKQNQLLFKKEIWFDRKLDSKKIKYLKNNLGNFFNAIVGKAITRNKNSINEIYEQLSI